MRVLIIFCFLSVLSAATLEVGPGKPFATPCAAFAVAVNGDNVNIDAAGNYTRNVCSISQSNLCIRGVNGRPILDSQGTVAGGKGIWNITGNDVIVDNIEFKNARSADRNGAGIRHEGRNLTVRRCYFHDNEDGILATSHAESQTIVEYSEFENNGTSNGQAHNIYVNTGAKLIFRFNYSHRAIGGHLLKSRAKENHILYNRLTQENGSGSYECDLPNQGQTWLIGNVIQQGTSSPNRFMITYGTENRDVIPGSHLYAFHNTIVNDAAIYSTQYLLAAPGDQRFPIIFGNNIIFGRGGFTASPTPVLLSNLITQTDPGFLNPTAFDYRLRTGSPAIDLGNGQYPGQVGAFVPPLFESLPRVCGVPRKTGDYKPDYGAYEWNVQNPAATTTCDASQAPEPGIKILMNGSTTLPSGQSGSGRIILNRAAPNSGLAVSLSSSAPADLTVPTSVLIPAGAISATFSFTSRVSSTAFTAKISAQADQVESSVILTLTAASGADKLTLEPATTVGGSAATLGRLTLRTAAPTGGLTVPLTSSNASVVQVPVQIVIPQGAVESTFLIKSSAVTVASSVVVTATFPGGKVNSTLLVQPVAILSVTPSSMRFVSGSSISLRVAFNGPAPSTSDRMTFTSSNASVVPVPASVGVALGSTSATATVRSSTGVTSVTTVTLTATYRGSSKAVSLTVDPQQQALASITSNLVSFGSGGTLRGTVTLTKPAVASTAVSLMSTNTALVRVPASVSVAAGAASVSFDMSTGTVTSPTNVVVTATSGGVTKTISLTLTPLGISSFVCPTSVKGGATITCTVKINGPAPTGGVYIASGTDSTAPVTVPPRVLMPAGQTAISFMLQTKVVSAPASAAIGVMLNATYEVVHVNVT